MKAIKNRVQMLWSVSESNFKTRSGLNRGFFISYKDYADYMCLEISFSISAGETSPTDLATSLPFFR